MPVRPQNVRSDETIHRVDLDGERTPGRLLAPQACSVFAPERVNRDIRER
jgi:hypothetical protein